MIILGISAFYHDAAAALVEDGRIVAAAQEERFSRRKHDSNFPREAEAAFGIDRLRFPRSEIPEVTHVDGSARIQTVHADTPEDAFRCFMGTELDTLAIGECILRKEGQDPALRRDYRNAFEPD